MYAVKAGSLSQTTKAVKLRNSRVSRMNERRFNTPLRAFLEHKYPTIYTEYTDLYRLMSTAHPRRKKLVSSTTFRQWKAANSPTVIPPACGDILTQALQETFATETPGQNSTTNSSHLRLNRIPIKTTTPTSKTRSPKSRTRIFKMFCSRTVPKRMKTS